MDSHVVAIIGETGILMPVLGASNDNGDTFGKTIMLNSVGQLSYFLIRKLLHMLEIITISDANTDGTNGLKAGFQV
jgi:hypothetical protein